VDDNVCLLALDFVSICSHLQILEFIDFQEGCLRMLHLNLYQ